jgi:tetrapyrrole methylase family protein/MazG family protein/ATP diphosphatase
MAKEEGRFSIDDVLDRLASKLVDRHPHVFSDVKAHTSAQVLRNWEALKAEEKKKRVGEKAASAEETESVLSGISSKAPALLEAHKLSSRAARVGFDWSSIDGLFDKLHEEIDELREEVNRFPPPGPQPLGRDTAGAGGPQVSDELRARMEDEVGDLFFVLVNIARYLSLDSESALRKSNRKFRRRFVIVEGELLEAGRTLDQASLDELETLWQQAKQKEKQTPPPTRS